MDPTVERLQRRLKGARWLNLGLALVVALLAGMLLAGRGTSQVAVPESLEQTAAPSRPPASSPTPEASEPGDTATASVVRADPSDTLAIGDIDAPVVMSEWVDLRCPFCAKLTNEVMPVLIEEYVATGKVRIEFNDVSFFGEYSTTAAVALRAAAEQGRFLEYLQTVHAAAPASGHPDLPRERLIEFAETAGVPDLDRFTADLDRADLRAAVEASTLQAQQWGISSVPFFVVGNQALSGAQPIEVFRQFLDSHLDAAGA